MNKLYFIKLAKNHLIGGFFQAHGDSVVLLNIISSYPRGKVRAEISHCNLNSIRS